MFKKIFLFLLLSSFAFAQVVYEPLNRDIYSFLAKLSQKSVIEFNDQIRPVSRKYVAQKLIEANQKSNQLTSLEKDELEFYSKDFRFEFELLNNVKNDSTEIIFFRNDFRFL